MKILALLLLSLQTASALPVPLEWEPSYPPLPGYHIIKSTPVGPVIIATVTEPQADVNLTPGEYQLFVVGFSDGGWSDPTNWLPVKIIVRKLEASDDLGSFKTVVEFEEIEVPRRFYRVADRD